MNWRLIILTATANLGGLLFGYDTGFIGGAVTMQSFKDDFGVTRDQQAAVAGKVVSGLQAGAFFGVLITSIIADRLGRKSSLAISGIVFDIGALMQTLAVGNLDWFFYGRIISGVGVGAASMLTPVFVSETAPKEIRGKLLTGFMFATFLGISIAYWIDYFCEKLFIGTNQWRVPVIIQLIPGLAITVGVIPLRESPRWLVKKGHLDRAWESLTYIRDGGDNIQEEYQEICQHVNSEMTQKRRRVSPLRSFSNNKNRIALGIGLMICQQLTGTISFTYYAPIFFKQVGLSGEAAGLFATGIYGIIKTIFSMIYMIWFIESIGRRKSLICGGVMMGSIMLIIGVILAQNNDKDSSIVASYFMIGLIYLFSVGYSGSWGPVPWTYSAEIFPSDIREYGVTLASATQWGANYCITQIIPIAIENLGWRLFIIFGMLNYGVTLIVSMWVKETQGLSLEEIDALFNHDNKRDEGPDEIQPLLSP